MSLELTFKCLELTRKLNRTTADLIFDAILSTLGKLENRIARHRVDYLTRMAEFKSTDIALVEAQQSDWSEPEKNLQNLQNPNLKGWKSKCFEEMLVDFIQNEELYVNVVLNQLVEFFKRLRAKRISKVTDKMIEVMSANVTTLLQYHCEFLRELKSETILDVKSAALSFSDRREHWAISFASILEKFSPFFNCYGVYIRNQPESLCLYRKLSSENKNFASFCKENFEVTGYKISSLLEIPIFRIGNYYIFLSTMLSAIQENKDSKIYEWSHVEECIQIAKDNIQTVLDKIGSQILDENNREAVLKAQNKFLFGILGRKKKNFVDPAKFLIKRSNVLMLVSRKNKSSLRKPIFLVLFNDEIMLVHPMSRKVQSSLKLNEIMNVCKYVGTVVEPLKPGEHSFRVSSYDSLQQVFIFILNSASERDQWIEKISTAVSTSNTEAEKRTQKFIPIELTNSGDSLQNYQNDIDEVVNVKKNVTFAEEDTYLYYEYDYQQEEEYEINRVFREEPKPKNPMFLPKVPPPLWRRKQQDQ